MKPNLNIFPLWFNYFLVGTGIEEAAENAIFVAQNGVESLPVYHYSGMVEHAIAHIEEAAVHHMPEEKQRFYGY